MPVHSCKSLISAAAATLLMLFYMPYAAAQAVFSKPGAAVTYRQGVFHVIGVHAQRLGSMAKGERAFDKSLAENDATVIDTLARQLDQSFPAGSDVAPSKAKPEIWQDATAFKQKLDEFKTTTGKLTIATRSGDVNLFKAAYNATAQTCKSCHDGFRNR